jgi:putative GTP pyrophosphokinase
MASSEKQDLPKVSIEQVLAEFDRKKEALTTFCEKTKILIEEILQDAKIQYQSVQARVKTRDKLRDKYLDQRRNYKKLDDITDQVAVRVITYYEDEVDRVAEIIKREFEIDPENSVDKREAEADKFGYYALNYVCKYSKVRTSQVEYKKFTDVWCEIQITSILRHTWSELEHPWYDLKDAFPASIKRRFARMAALLEIAESEFLSLRKVQSDYQKSVAVRVEANVPDLPVDAVSLRTFIEQDPLVAEVDRSLSLNMGLGISESFPDGWTEARAAALKKAGLTKLQDVSDCLKSRRNAIPEYVRRCRKELWPPAPQGVLLYKGISLHHLAGFVVSLEGEEKLIEFHKASGFVSGWDIKRQVEIAREVALKFPD